MKSKCQHQKFKIKMSKSKIQNQNVKIIMSSGNKGLKRILEIVLFFFLKIKFKIMIVLSEHDF